MNHYEDRVGSLCWATMWVIVLYLLVSSIVNAVT